MKHPPWSYPKRLGHSTRRQPRLLALCLKRCITFKSLDRQLGKSSNRQTFCQSVHFLDCRVGHVLQGLPTQAAGLLLRNGFQIIRTADGRIRYDETIDSFLMKTKRIWKHYHLVPQALTSDCLIAFAISPSSSSVISGDILITTGRSLRILFFSAMTFSILHGLKTPGSTRGSFLLRFLRVIRIPSCSARPLDQACLDCLCWWQYNRRHVRMLRGLWCSRQGRLLKSCFSPSLRPVCDWMRLSCLCRTWLDCRRLRVHGYWTHTFDQNHLPTQMPIIEKLHSYHSDYLLIIALSSSSLKTLQFGFEKRILIKNWQIPLKLQYLGFSFPSCGSGVTDPISTNPKPSLNMLFMVSPCLSKPAAKPTGLLNVRLNTLTDCNRQFR